MLRLLALCLLTVQIFANVEEKTVCEHQQLKIDCVKGGVYKEINILSASYGRTEQNVCGNGANTNCHAGTSISVVRNECQGQPSCTLYAKNSAFGDPCRGTFKYLKVKYECVGKKITGDEKTVCEHQQTKIDCVRGGVYKEINILSASYGRTEQNVCGSGANTNCHAGTSMNVVRYECQGQPSCTLHAKNSAFEDPCSGTFKYLKVKYECVDKKFIGDEGLLLRVCEGATRSISCRAGRKKINILSANYGRLTGAHICPGPVKTTNCGAAGSLGKVRSKCQGKRFCALQATNSEFGDPCVGTKKYLEIRYKCNK